MPKKLSTILTFWYAASFLVILGTTFLITWTAVDNHFQNQIDEDLLEDLEEFRNFYRQGGLELIKQEIVRENGPEDRQTEFFRILSPLGEVASSPNLSTLASRSEELDIEFPSSSLNHRLQLTKLRIGTDRNGETEPIEFREIIGSIGPGLALHMGEAVAWKTDAMLIVRNAFLSILSLGIPLISFIGWLMARRAVSGVEHVSNIAERIHRGHMDERVCTEASEVEVIRLSNAFNAMLDRIRDLVTEMREMTDNIAHDLKSPLARIRFMSEIALSRNLNHEEQDENALQTIEECDRLIGMINTSLDVAEAETGIGFKDREDLDFSNLVEQACELFWPVAEELSVSLSCNIQKGCRFYGNLAHLQRVISNLIDNALKYTNQNGSIMLSLEYDSDRILVTVSDTGIGIPSEEHASIFKRFYRCDRSRSKEGCGLGLSYTRAIAHQYNGEISVQSAIQKGSTFTLILPLASQAQTGTEKNYYSDSQLNLDFGLPHNS